MLEKAGVGEAGEGRDGISTHKTSACGPGRDQLHGCMAQRRVKTQGLPFKNQVNGDRALTKCGSF